MKVKVCGITQLDQLYELSEIGANYAGFIFYAPSPRSVLRSEVAGADIKKAHVKLYKVGVFVNASYDEVMRRIDEYGLDMVQLHGHETPFECQKIVAHIDVIKAFRFSDNDHVMWTIKDFYSDTDMFLFDTGVTAPKEEKDKTVYGGTGRKFDWSRLKGLAINKPFLLSGGIEPTDASSVRKFMKDVVAKDLMAVDINSRFEKAPGVKDMKKVKKFIAELRK